MSDSPAKDPITLLGSEEYIEQGHFFRTLAEQLEARVPTQDILMSVREEILATTKLPMAIDFLLAELRHAGVFHTAMEQLPHYFSPFQSFIVAQAENERGQFDFRIGLRVLEREAEYRAARSGQVVPSRQGLFLFQLEVLCRNRLSYDHGLTAIAADTAYDEPWREWILTLRRRIGMVDIADLLYVQSAHYTLRSGDEPTTGEPLFGDREGRIALANRRKDPLYLFASLHRQLGYPEVPRPAAPDATPDLLPQIARKLEQLEKRMSLIEEEQRGGIDLTQFYEKPPEAS